MNYKKLNEGKQQFITESSTEVSSHVGHEAHHLDNIFYEIINLDDDWTSRGYKDAIAIKILKSDFTDDNEHVTFLLYRHDQSVKIYISTHRFRKYSKMKAAGSRLKAYERATNRMQYSLNYSIKIMSENNRVYSNIKNFL